MSFFYCLMNDVISSMASNNYCVFAHDEKLKHSLGCNQLLISSIPKVVRGGKESNGMQGEIC